ncbi:MAG: hypothetical protein COS94_07690, partial [Candidatus Hydrogenedentes bacterium CG07_land_8_20_14_0_80_42_17]
KIKFSICTFQFAISNIMRNVMEAQAPRVNGRPRVCKYFIRMVAAGFSRCVLFLIIYGNSSNK